MRTVFEIRVLLAEKYKNKEITNGTVELIGESFIADTPAIFGAVNDNYVKRELDWYLSESLNVNDIQGKVPPIWLAHSTPEGLINSNYGYLAFGKENGSQYLKVFNKLSSEPGTRQATMIYTRPTMHEDWNQDGMSDFVCTNTVQYLIRDKKLHVVVQMRSNDVVFGYRNDYAWQLYVRDNLINDLNSFSDEVITAGEIYWNASSLHLYERHFHLVDNWLTTGDFAGEL